MMRQIKKFWFLLFLIPIFIWVFWHIFYLALTENLEVKKGSLDYYLTIQFSTLQNFPLVGKIGEEKYYSDCGDGAKSPHNQVVYKSVADKDLMLQIFNSFLVERGYKKDNKYSNLNEFFYEKNYSKKAFYIYIYSIGENKYIVEITDYN